MRKPNTGLAMAALFAGKDRPAVRFNETAGLDGAGLSATIQSGGKK